MEDKIIEVIVGIIWSVGLLLMGYVTGFQVGTWSKNTKTFPGHSNPLPVPDRPLSYVNCNTMLDIKQDIFRQGIKYGPLGPLSAPTHKEFQEWVNRPEFPANKVGAPGDYENKPKERIRVEKVGPTREGGIF